MAVTHWSEKVFLQACCCGTNYHFFAKKTPFLPKKVREEMREVCSKRCGINSFKMYMAYKDLIMVRDHEMLEIFKTCRELGAIGQVCTVLVGFFLLASRT